MVKMTSNGFLKLFKNTAVKYKWEIDKSGAIRTKTENMCPISSLKGKHMSNFEKVADEFNIPESLWTTIVSAADSRLAFCGEKAKQLRISMLEILGLA